jgi:hypothetical protein
MPEARPGMVFLKNAWHPVEAVEAYFQGVMRNFDGLNRARRDYVREHGSLKGLPRRDRRVVRGMR